MTECCVSSVKLIRLKDFFEWEREKRQRQQRKEKQKIVLFFSCFFLNFFPWVINRLRELRRLTKPWPDFHERSKSKGKPSKEGFLCPFPPPPPPHRWVGVVCTRKPSRWWHALIYPRLCTSSCTHAHQRHRGRNENLVWLTQERSYTYSTVDIGLYGPRSRIPCFLHTDNKTTA